MPNNIQYKIRNKNIHENQAYLYRLCGNAFSGDMIMNQNPRVFEAGVKGIFLTVENEFRSCHLDTFGIVKLYFGFLRKLRNMHNTHYACFGSKS